MGKSSKKRISMTHVEDIMICGTVGRMAPIGLQMYAADFLLGAKAMPIPEVPFSPARIYLACHALELGLKAFLSFKGISLSQLSEIGLGHNLSHLLDEAIQNGLMELVKLEEAHLGQIRHVSDYYLKKIFEYPAVHQALIGYPGYADTSVLIQAADILLVALYEPCLTA